MRREYSNFGRSLARLIQPAAESHGFERITDTAYAKAEGGFWKVFNFQLSRADGIDFYVNYGVAMPTLGAPWYAEDKLRDSGLLVSERLFHAGGQGFPCATLSELAASSGMVLGLLETILVRWFEDYPTLAEVNAEYSRRWELVAPPGNLALKRQGVLNYALMLFAAGDSVHSRDWLLEAERLMLAADETEDLIRVRNMLAAAYMA